MIPVLLALPWIGIIVFLLLIVKPVRQLTSTIPFDSARAPLVSVIIPARDEAENP